MYAKYCMYLCNFCSEFFFLAQVALLVFDAECWLCCIWKNQQKQDRQNSCKTEDSTGYLQRVGSHALPLLCRFLHGLAQGLGVVDDGLQLGVSQHPEQVIQDKEQLGGQNIAVLYLEHRYDADQVSVAAGCV